MTRVLEVRDLGRTTFHDALALQGTLSAGRRCGEGVDTLLTTEHEPVVTLGRACTGLPAGARAALAAAGIPVVPVGRGGEATYHGPGQLVGYPILDLTPLGRDLHAYVGHLEHALVAALARLGVQAEPRPGRRGVWVAGAKIASIGVAVRGWVTCHGFALNVSCDLAPFGLFAPCGLEDVRMTSLSEVTGGAPSPESVRAAVVEAVAERLGYSGCPIV